MSPCKSPVLLYSEEFVKQSVHNFSSYQQTAEEQVALSFGLDQHIPTSLRRDDVKTEFELFFQNLLTTISPLPDEKKEVLKTKLRSTFDNYSRIKVPYKHRKVIDTLSKRKDIVVMKQDKGRGVVILDKCHYTEKCLNF